MPKQITHFGPDEAFALAGGTAESPLQPRRPVMKHADIEIASEFVGKAVIVGMEYPGIGAILQFPTVQQHLSGGEGIFVHYGMPRKTAGLQQRATPVAGKGIGDEYGLDAEAVAVGQAAHLAVRRVIEQAGVGAYGTGATCGNCRP